MPLRRNAQPQKRVIDPRFPIPEGLGDLEYVNTKDESDIWYDPELEPEDDADKDPQKKKKKKKKKRKKKGKNKNKKGNKKKEGKKKKDRDEDRGRKGINTPKSLEVLKQKMRTKADGSQVVDVTLEVDRILKANKYEFRITKKDTGRTTIQTEQA